MQLNKPTPAEVLDEVRQCPCCGYNNPTLMTKEELILELVERVDALEQKLETMVSLLSIRGASPNA